MWLGPHKLKPIKSKNKELSAREPSYIQKYQKIKNRIENTLQLQKLKREYIEETIKSKKRSASNNFLGFSKEKNLFLIPENESNNENPHKNKDFETEPGNRNYEDCENLYKFHTSAYASIESSRAINHSGNFIEKLEFYDNAGSKSYQKNGKINSFYEKVLKKNSDSPCMLLKKPRDLFVHTPSLFHLRNDQNKSKTPSSLLKSNAKLIENDLKPDLSGYSFRNPDQMNIFSHKSLSKVRNYSNQPRNNFPVLPSIDLKLQLKVRTLKSLKLFRN